MSGSQTTSTTSGPPQAVQQAYGSLVNAAGGVATNPLNIYSGPMVAGFTPQQSAGFQTIDQSQGIGTPYLNAAAQEFGAATTPLWPTLPQFNASTVNQYLSPYTQDVTGALTNLYNNQNAQQQQQIQGNATARGAYGGDREAVAQALAAQQEQLAQAPTLAQVEQQGYQQATGEFNQQQQAQLAAEQANAWLNSQAAFGMGGLGTEAQNLALQGAQAEIGAGGMQQQQAQQLLNIPYQQFVQTQAYPYQQLGFLSPIVEGTGSLSGGTGTTTSPGPSALSQAAGLGLTGLGVYGLGNQMGWWGGSGLSNADFSNIADSVTGISGARRGGRIGYAEGGHANDEIRVPFLKDDAMPLPNWGWHGDTGTVRWGYSGTPVLPFGVANERASGGRIGYAGGGMTMPTVPAIGSTVPTIDLSYIPQAAPGGVPSNLGLHMGNQTTQTQSSDSGIGGVLGPLSLAVKVGSMFMKDGGHAHREAGGAAGNNIVVPPLINLDYITHANSPAVRGAGPPQPPHVNPGQDSGFGVKDAMSLMGGIKDLKGLGVLGGDSTAPNSASGGRIGYDAGGNVPLGAAIAFGGAPPNMQQMYQQLLELPLQRLQEMAVQFPPTSQQGQIVQQVLRQKQMTPGAGTAPAGVPGGQQIGSAAAPTGMPPSPSGTASVANSPQDYGGTSHAMAAGGNPPADDPRGYVTPDELDPHPVVDHSGDTVVVRYPSEKKSLDLGLPSIKGRKDFDAGGATGAASMGLPQVAWSGAPGSAGWSVAGAPVNTPSPGLGGASVAPMTPMPFYGYTQGGNGVGYLNAANGTMIPQLATSDIAGSPIVNSNTTTIPAGGGGIGSWFNPVQTPYAAVGAGPNGPGGSMTFPSATAYTPGMGAVFQGITGGKEGPIPQFYGGPPPAAPAANPSATVVPGGSDNSAFLQDTSASGFNGKRGGRFGEGGTITLPSSDYDWIEPPPKGWAGPPPSIPTPSDLPQQTPAQHEKMRRGAAPHYDDGGDVPAASVPIPPVDAVGGADDMTAAASVPLPPPIPSASDLPVVSGIGDQAAGIGDTSDTSLRRFAAQPTGTEPPPPSIPPINVPVPRGTVQADQAVPAPTSKEPAAEPQQANVFAVGDSQAWGLVRHGGLGGTTSDTPLADVDASIGRSPRAIYQYIADKAKEGYWKGKDVVLATGVQNDPSQVGFVPWQIQALRDGGANVVGVSGFTGTGAKGSDMAPIAEQVTQFAQEKGVPFGGLYTGDVRPNDPAHLTAQGYQKVGNWYRGVGGTGASTAPAAAPAAAPVPTGGGNYTAPVPARNYTDAIIGVESGGDPTIRNPHSTAGGLGQFIDRTWLNVIKSHHPDIAAGKTDAQLIAMKTDPAFAGLQRQAIEDYRSDNAAEFQKIGIQPTDANLSLAHFLGPQGAATVLRANPDTPVAQLLPAAAQANPFLNTMTAGQLIASREAMMRGEAVANRVGGQGSGALPSDMPPPSGEPVAQAQNIAHTVLASAPPETRSGMAQWMNSPYFLAFLAGAGMLASRSPFPGVAIGEGLQGAAKGMETVAGNQLRADQLRNESEYRNAELGLRGQQLQQTGSYQSAELDVRRQTAERQLAAENQRYQTEMARLTTQDAREREIERHNQATEAINAGYRAAMMAKPLPSYQIGPNGEVITGTQQWNPLTERYEFTPGATIGRAPVPTGERALALDLVHSGAAKDEAEAIQKIAQLKRNPQADQASYARLVQAEANRLQQSLQGMNLSQAQIEAQARRNVASRLGASPTAQPQQQPAAAQPQAPAPAGRTAISPNGVRLYSPDGTRWFSDPAYHMPYQAPPAQ